MMKILIFFILIVLQACKTPREIRGTYKNTAKGNRVYEKYIFSSSSKEFEYYFRGEGVLEYNRGAWHISKNKIFAQGFNDSSVNKIYTQADISRNLDSRNLVNIKSTLTDDDKIVCLDAIINDSLKYHFQKDTALQIVHEISTIQLKAYLQYQGMMSPAQTVDTLYSNKIELAHKNGLYNKIQLKLLVKRDDFFRVVKNDTLSLRKNLLVNANGEFEREN